MQDILPPEIYLWQSVERTAREVFTSFGFQEVRVPVAESTELFIRSIGENTDIVEKEMYTFNDKAGRSMTLRPEGTASVVRCYIQNNLSNLPSPQKFYYSGPMFRYERPQAGRLRQFYQIGVEAFGSAEPEMDAEVISMLRHTLTKIGLDDIVFQINSIGCEECRTGYRKSLVEYFSGTLDNLCDDCRRRYSVNPLRILDCKVSRCAELRTGAPVITGHLCTSCRTHFDKLLSLLDLLHVAYQIKPDMVRGLDYYTGTIFEVTDQSLGAQNAVAAGGRYDRLVREFGGPETPAVGFAIGMERIIELLKRSRATAVRGPDVFIAAVGDAGQRESFLMADSLRASGFWIETGHAGNSLKSQMRKADRLSSAYVFVLGDEEIHAGRMTWKRLSDAANGTISMNEAADFLLKNRS